MGGGLAVFGFSVFVVFCDKKNNEERTVKQEEKKNGGVQKTKDRVRVVKKETKGIYYNNSMKYMYNICYIILDVRF